MKISPVSYTHLDVYKRQVNAASIGQVHKAKKNGQELAVKIQYPGVQESISSDLKLVKPIATVSYTHLDVYKRQIYMLSNFWLKQSRSSGKRRTVFFGNHFRG